MFPRTFKNRLICHALALPKCDQIGLFLKGLGGKMFIPMLPKSYANFWHFLKQVTVLSKNCCGYFLGNFWNFSILFIPTSGHTGCNRNHNRRQFELLLEPAQYVVSRLNALQLYMIILTLYWHENCLKYNSTIYCIILAT